MEKKQLILVLALVLFLVITGFVVWQNRAINPTPQTATSTATTTSFFDMEPIVPEAKVSTEGWKTCRNEEYGYEFKFPAEWHIYGEDAYNDAPKPSFIRESNGCNGLAVLLSEMTIENYRDGDVINKHHIGVGVRLLGENEDSQYLNDFATSQKKQSDIQKIQIDEQDSVLQVNDYVPLYGGRGWRAVAINNNMIYTINGGYYDEDIITIYTILSTFHFLDTATSTEQ